MLVLAILGYLVYSVMSLSSAVHRCHLLFRCLVLNYPHRGSELCSGKPLSVDRNPRPSNGPVRIAHCRWRGLGREMKKNGQVFQKVLVIRTLDKTQDYSKRLLQFSPEVGVHADITLWPPR